MLYGMEKNVRPIHSIILFHARGCSLLGISMFPKSVHIHHNHDTVSMVIQANSKDFNLFSSFIIRGTFTSFTEIKDVSQMSK